MRPNVFGSEARIRRPVLLAVVFGGFLVIVGITATSQAAIVSADLTTTTFEAVVGSDAASVRNLANATLQRSDVSSPGPDANRIVELQATLDTLIKRGEIVRAEIARPDGTIIASDLAGQSGTRHPVDASFSQAAANQPAVDVVPTNTAGIPLDGIHTDSLLRESLPLSVDGSVQAIVTLYRDAAPILAKVDAVRRDVVMVTISAAVIAGILLYLIFRGAQSRITRQTEQLVRTAREDALTGLLNHGTMVGRVATGIEAARADGTAFGLALVDIDNFRLLNQHRGHDVGDLALTRVATALRGSVPAEAVVGRYGPDEFLVIVDRDHIAELEPAIERLRLEVADVALEVDGEEDRLPLTVSAAIATFPLDGGSLTAILSVLARTLEIARNSGGDAVRVASREATPEEAAAGGFDVLRGLVIAIDTKDRYTKRHSEDVARYAVFLARQLGLDETQVATIERAGVLHDVGKIGIPDTILRKPGRLTSEEMAIVRQHVALGDMIVRDVPDLDAVRAGIRHHHERWDGDGYLDGLAGERIPLIARILAVGDAFSAMTTSRPYRKALDIQEALRRLEDASGSQLDEHLVRVFVSGLEGRADAPLPGSQPVALWTPATEVA